MEGSKAFSKAFMQRHSIPTAEFRVFRADQVDKAISHVKTCGFKVVLKASGLAAGKGVLIPTSTEEAIAGLREIMVDNVFGDAGSQVVVEELLEGPELSVLAFCDGYTIIPLPAAQDHKRIGEGDTGPNTGGMGAYAPAPIATPALMDRILKEALQPTIDGMRKEGKGTFQNTPYDLPSSPIGFPFVGILFTGFMVTEDGPKVLEYNVRFGDPETQALMLLLSENTDIAEVALVRPYHPLPPSYIRFLTTPRLALSTDWILSTSKRNQVLRSSVVLASQGYPGSYPKGKQITIGSVPSSGSVGLLRRNLLMRSLQMPSSSMPERPGPTIKSLPLAEESSQSRRAPKPFRLHWISRTPQSTTSNSTAKRTVGILVTGNFSAEGCDFPLVRLSTYCAGLFCPLLAKPKA
jgi:phosphoribosylamine--glycine ligase/phosphoribosylformylglycinamidine cyclo-ligase